MCSRYLMQLLGWDVFALCVQESSPNNTFVHPKFFIPWQYWSREGWDHAQQCKTKAKTSMQSTFPSQWASCTWRMEMRLLDFWSFQGGSWAAKVGKASKSSLLPTYSMCQHQTISYCCNIADTAYEDQHVNYSILCFSKVTLLPSPSWWMWLFIHDSTAVSNDITQRDHTATCGRRQL